MVITKYYLIIVLNRKLIKKKDYIGFQFTYQYIYIVTQEFKYLLPNLMRTFKSASHRIMKNIL